MAISSTGHRNVYRQANGKYYVSINLRGETLYLLNSEPDLNTAVRVASKARRVAAILAAGNAQQQAWLATIPKHDLVDLLKNPPAPAKKPAAES